MSTKTLPEEIKDHPLAKPGGFYAKAWNDGAASFGWVAVREDNGRSGDLGFFPLNWPGGFPEGCKFLAAAKWESGRVRFEGRLLSEEETARHFASLGEEESTEVSSATEILQLIGRYETEGQAHERYEAAAVKSLSPNLDGLDAAELARVFMSGFRAANMLAEREIIELQRQLALQAKRRSLRYHDAAKLAMEKHGSKGALALLQAIGARRIEGDDNSVTWENFAGEIVDIREWEKAVKSAKQTLPKG